MDKWDSDGVPILDVNSYGSGRFYASEADFLKRMDELAPKKKSRKEKVMLWFNKLLGTFSEDGKDEIHM